MTLSLATILALPAAAQTRPSATQVLQAAFSMTSYGGVAISPRGDAVLYAVTTRPGGMKNPMPQTALYVQRGTTAPARLTAGDGKAFFEESDAQFSPDGSHSLSSRTRETRSSRKSTWLAQTVRKCGN